jgi:hypothetical protein
MASMRVGIASLSRLPQILSAGFPQNRQRRCGCFVIDSLARHLRREDPFFTVRLSQCSDRMLTMKTRYFDELVENFFLVDACCGMLAFRNRINQFASGCQTELPPDSVARHSESEGVTFS